MKIQETSVAICSVSSKSIIPACKMLLSPKAQAAFSQGTSFQPTDCREGYWCVAVWGSHPWYWVSQVTRKRCRNPKPGPPRPSGRVSSNRSRRFPWPANASKAADTTWIAQCLLRDCFYPKVWHCQIVRFSRSHFCRALKLAHHPGPLWGNGVPHKIELIKFSHVDRCNLIRFRTVWQVPHSTERRLCNSSPSCVDPAFPTKLIIQAATATMKKINAATISRI